MFNPNFCRVTSVALAAFIAVLLIACGDNDTGLSRADVTDIVRTELANAPAPTSPGPSVAEVERIVQDYIADIPKPAPGVTSSEVEELIRDSIGDIPEPVFGVTSEEVEGIVRDSIADIPEPAPGLTSADVERIVQAAIADLPAPDAMKATEMADAKVSYVPLRSSTAEYTQYFVKNAIKKYESEGLDATVAYYNTPESIDGPWYVFIGDQDDMMLAHAANPDLVGRPFSYATGPNAYPAGDAVAASADQDGEWFSYTYPNPATGGIESKHSWMVRYDGLIFGSGWYEDGPAKSDAPAYTKEFVRQAIYLYDAVGLDETVAYYNNPESIDGQWYVFIGDQDDMMLAHAANPDLVGRPFSYATGPNEYPAGLAVAASADQDGEWFSYTYPNPSTGGVETKHSWMVRYDGLLFGSGWYEDGPAKSNAPAYTKEFVRQAIYLYDAVGLDETVAYYNNMESLDDQWYMVIIDENGYIISHPNPERLGLDANTNVDINGYAFGADSLMATEAGRWVDYVFLNLQSGKEQQKHTWVVRHDGLFFASGWYEQ